MRTKIKISKQQIKEDRFTVFILRSREWIADNWQVISIIAAIVILIIAGSVYYLKMRSGKEAAAADRLTTAQAELARQNYQVATLELKSLSDEYGGRLGGMALFYLGNAYYDSRNYDEAINSYKKYISDYHLDDLTTSSAIAGIAASLEGKQEYLAAGDKYAEDIKGYPDSPAAPYYYVNAVRNYVQGGDRQKAGSLVQEMQTKYPNTDYLRTATRLLMQLKAE